VELALGIGRGDGPIDRAGTGIDVLFGAATQQLVVGRNYMTVPAHETLQLVAARWAWRRR